MSSDSIRGLRSRIRSVTATQQMTSAMKTVAVSKYNRLVARRNAFAEYNKRCNEVLDTLGGIELRTPAKIKNPGKICYVVMTANRGLCGAYNSELKRYFKELIGEEQKPWCMVLCGRWGFENLASVDSEVLRKFHFKDVPEYHEADELAKYLEDLYFSGEVAEVRIVSQSFVNIITQKPDCHTFLPNEHSNEKKDIDPDMLFLPTRKEVMDEVVDRYLTAQIFGTLLTVAMGANGSMLMAMRTASDNSTEMLSQLELKLNRVRQASVTSEVLDISNSALGSDYSKG